MVVDDEASFRKAVCLHLQNNGFRTDECACGKDAVITYTPNVHDLVILDIMMVGGDGFEACDAIRKIDQHIPILFLSAKGDLVDKRIGYQLGCDDYITKPFNPDELILRVKALLRRSMGFQKHGDEARSYLYDGLSVDFEQDKVYLDGKEIHLTPNELRIVMLLARQPGEAFSKRDIIRSVWGEEYVGTSISIPVYIKRIREKLGDAPDDPHYLKTSWGYGYYIAAAR